MTKVKVYKNREDIFIPLEQYVDEYCKEAPEGWFEGFEEFINSGMNISNDIEYIQYLKKMNLRWFDYKEVNILYKNLKESKYNKMFEDDILRYIAHMYGVGYFQRIKYEVDINNPNFDSWLNVKNAFKPNSNNIPSDEGFSLMDLVLLKNASNAIRRELMFSSKW